MKSSLLLLAVLTPGALLADNASLSGKWEIYTSIGGNDSNLLCTFTQNEADLTGSCTGERGAVQMVGKVDGSKVTFSYKSEYQGTPLTVAYSGTIGTDSRIKGRVEVPEFGASGEFTANQSK